jgi:synaptobrevin family protein YKT6
MITDSAYPSSSASVILAKVINDFASKYPTEVWKKAGAFDWPEIRVYLAKYQDPNAT